MYTPQMAAPQTPEGWVDEEFTYYFDSTTNTPALGTILTPGETLFNIPLQLQADAIFIVRGIQVANPQQNLGLRFRDPLGHYLSDDFVPSYMFASFQPTVGSLPGIQASTLEPEIFCPAGSQLLVDIANIG